MFPLSALRGQFYKFVGERTFQQVDNLAEADSVMFLCPKCFTANSGSIGTHSIRIDFAGRGTPIEHCIKNAQGKPVYWQVSGSSMNDLTLKPSIQILAGCAWHGFVTNGQVHE